MLHQLLGWVKNLELNDLEGKANSCEWFANLVLESSIVYDFEENNLEGVGIVDGLNLWWKHQK